LHTYREKYRTLPCIGFFGLTYSGIPRSSATPKPYPITIWSANCWGEQKDNGRPRKRRKQSEKKKKKKKKKKHAQQVSARARKHTYLFGKHRRIVPRPATAVAQNLTLHQWRQQRHLPLHLLNLPVNSF
jgi:hypothetical protein